MNIFSPLFLYLICLGLLAVGSVVSLFAMKSDRVANAVSNTAAMLASACGFASSVWVLASGEGALFSAQTFIPGLAVSVNIDRLSAFFVLIISFVAFFASMYGFGYVKHYFGRYNIGKLGFFYNLFIAGMIMVASAHNAFFFLIAWEIMSLASYFLVVFEDKDRNNVSAGTLYFIMTHIGTAFIILSFLLLYGATGTFDFSAIKANAGMIAPAVRDAVFVLALAGFGTKAGVIPLHVWLPSAHPAAPTYVSALMSGVMIKTGILMMIRVFIDLLPNPPLWWGIVVLAIGAVSALLGVLYALTEYDIKRLLAYSSVENIGIIMLGLGSALVFLSLGMNSLAILALVASLFHAMNHAIFKSLLFLGAGAVISATHTRNMEEYGGLIKRMPQTAFFFLAGSMAISALPPWNGFFSEWATFQAMFSGLNAGGTGIKLVFVMAAGSLVFTGGLAAACFVKAFGATFLARPRGEEAKHAHEPAVLSRVAMGALALAALGTGIFAGNIANVLAAVASDLDVFGFAAPAFFATALSFGTANGFAAVSMPLVFLAIVIAFFGVAAAVRTLAGRGRVARGRTWDCGSDLGPRMEITATGFSCSIITVFEGILKPSKQTSVEYRDADMRYFVKASTVKLGVGDIYAKYFYRPLQKAVTKLADKVKTIQGGNVNAYVLYIFLTLLFFLFIIEIK